MTRRKQRHQVSYLAQTFLFPLFLFTIALLPRLLALDVFLTSDEYRWLGRSRDFLVGVLSRDWAATLQTGHPGVTTMWTGSLGLLYNYWTRLPSAPDDLLAFVQQVPNEPLDAAYIAPMRFPTVLLISLSVVIYYVLISRLFESQVVGAVAALLLALNPFHVALSRILHHDALATTFMTLALLPLLGYWLQGWSRGWLLFSAVAAGLSFLSKSPAMFLMPFCALLGLAWTVRRWREGEWRGWPDVRRLLTDGLLWGAVAWLTVLIMWPAMWVIPFKVLGVVFGTSSQYATEGHGKGNFFLGRITRDPGPLFYPLSWLLRTTPLTLLGLLALGGVYLRNALSRRSERRPRNTSLWGMMLLYAGLFVAFMTLGEKKQNRYILPIYPVLDGLAAMGWVCVSNIKRQIPRSKHQIGSAFFLISPIILVISGILLITNYPYYFTYYNPLLGGARTAARVMTIGWGEGLDQAAAYLNDISDAEQLRVTSWYHNSFAPFFQGEATYYASDAGQTLSSDYAVVYRNQIQRELPTSELVHYLVEHHTPVFTVTLQGVDYIYLYALPLFRRSHWQESSLPGRVTFFGVGRLETSDEAEPDVNSDSLALRLYWQNEGLTTGERWWVALQAVDGPLQPWQACQVRPDFVDEKLTIGALLESDCRLTGEWFPPGVYHLRVGVGSGPNQVTGVSFSEGELAVAVGGDGQPRLVSRLAALDTLARRSLSDETHSADLVYRGAVRLIGYKTEDVSTEGGRHLRVQNYWQALQPLPLGDLNEALRVEISLLSPQEKVLGRVESQFSDPETWPTVWPAGQILTRTLSLSLPHSIDPQSQLRLDVWLNDQRLAPSDSEGEMVEPILAVFLP